MASGILSRSSRFLARSAFDVAPKSLCSGFVSAAGSTSPALFRPLTTQSPQRFGAAFGLNRFQQSRCMSDGASPLSPVNGDAESASACAMAQAANEAGASSAGDFDESQIYRAGLRHTEFTNSCEISSDSQVIPIFRVMGYDGKLKGDWEPPMTAEECVESYKFMVRLSVYDLMMYTIQRQGRISFYMQNQGEEALQTAVANGLEKDDVLWCQYRELGVLMWRGFSVEDALSQLFSTEDDPGKGRQMPISYTKKEIGLQTICTPLTTQLPHAAGCGYAFKLSGADRASVAFFGEGAASEGDFHAAMNFAAVHQCQTLFVCRNNGYAISTPVAHQYKGDGIAIRGLAYGMDTIRVDGNDFFASYIATKKARRLCAEKGAPVCLEFMTYRMGHHSTSDDSAQYRPPREMSLWTQAGIDGIARFRLFLENNGLWNEEKEQELRKEAKQTMLKEIKKAEQKKSVPIIEGVFDDVYDQKPWHLKEQEEHLRQHLQRHGNEYDLSKYRGI